MQLTYRFRLSDTCDSELSRQARAVNTVFNFANETSCRGANHEFDLAGQ